MSGASTSRPICGLLLAGALIGASVGCSSDAPAADTPRSTASAAARRSATAATAGAKAKAKRKADVARWAKAVAAERRAAALRGKDRRLFLMSDSVMLGAQSALPKALPTWKVNLDGKESRFFSAGLDVLAARRREMGRVVVIQMGNNYAGNASLFRSQIDQAMKILKGVEWVVFLTVFEYRSNQAEVNNELRAAAERYPTVRIADWNAFERAHPGHTSHDGLHLKPSGATLMADFVASVVNALPA